MFIIHKPKHHLVSKTINAPTFFTLWNFNFNTVALKWFFSLETQTNHGFSVRPENRTVLVPQPCFAREQGPDGLGGPSVFSQQPLCLSASSLHFKEPLTALLISTFSPFFSDTNNKKTFICVVTIVCIFSLLCHFLIFCCLKMSK